MTNDDERSDTPSHRTFDLAERSAVFAERLIIFLKRLPSNEITIPLKRQAIRSGTSIGANYNEADEAGSKKEFRHIISLCKREAKETMYWLRMLAAAIPDEKGELRQLWKESRELSRIFAAIHRKSASD
jgi:four helix bundle protein